MYALQHPLYWPSGFPRTPPGRRQTRVGCRDYVTARNMAISEIHALGGFRLVFSSLVGSGSIRSGDPTAAIYFRVGGGSYVLCCDRYTKLACNLMAIAETARLLRRAMQGASAHQVLAPYETTADNAQLADQEAQDVTQNRNSNPFGTPRPPPRGENPFTSRRTGSTFRGSGSGPRQSWMPGPGDFTPPPPPEPPKPKWWKKLGLSKRPGSLREAEKAYRKLVLKHHPDRNAGASEEKMREINEAIEQARDDMRR